MDFQLYNCSYFQKDLHVQNMIWQYDIIIYLHICFLNNRCNNIFLIYFFLGKPTWILWTDINQVIKVQVINFCDLPDEWILRVILWHPCRIFKHGEVSKYVHSSYQIHTPKLPVRTSLPGPSVQKNISNTIPNVKPSEQDQCIAWSLEYPQFS